MLLALPGYLGLDSLSGPWFKTLAGWLSLGLALPVLLFSAADYRRSAWISLKRRALTPSNDSAVLNQGLLTYTTLCAPCHRPDGGGQVGPNLCDDYWIHGSNYLDNIKTIINGVPEKGMLTWRGVLKPGRRSRTLTNEFLGNDAATAPATRTR